MQLNEIPFADKTITVYNSYVFTDEYNKHQTRWTSYVFKDNAIFKQTQQTTISDMVHLEGDFFVAQAPNDSNYLPFFEWMELPKDEINNYFTVQNGDIIVNGDIVIEIPPFSSPISEIKKLYPNIGNRMFTAKSAQDNTNKAFPETSHFYWAG